MTEAIHVLRTARVEVVDHKGRVRVVIGALTDEPDLFGVSVRDRFGHERLYLVTDEDDFCQAGITAGGNNLAGADAAADGRVSLFLADSNGAVAQSLTNNVA